MPSASPSVCLYRPTMVNKQTNKQTSFCFITSHSTCEGAKWSCTKFHCGAICSVTGRSYDFVTTFDAYQDRSRGQGNYVCVQSTKSVNEADPAQRFTIWLDMTHLDPLSPTPAEIGIQFGSGKKYT